MNAKGEPSPGPVLTRNLAFAMAVAAGVAAANVYYNQPMLGVLEADMPGPSTALVSTATQLGYAGGLFLTVPLGDLFERRRLIVGHFIVMALALAAAALSPSPLPLMISSFVLGASATVAQHLVPFAAQLAVPERRTTSTATVVTGILCGMLLSRTLSGLVTAHAGWRAMFWLAVPIALAAGAWMRLALPRSATPLTSGYTQLLVSMAELWRDLRDLRIAAITQAFIFAAFITFWTLLALHLQEPPFQLGADVAGLFGIVGLAGILAAPVAGRLADARGPGNLVMFACLLGLLSWVVFALIPSLLGLIVGVVLLDLAMQIGIISNQGIIYGLRAEARSRINGLFMGTMFVGGASGSATASIAWHWFGWTGALALGFSFSVVALIIQYRHRRPFVPS